MDYYQKIIGPLLRKFSVEDAHNIAIAALKLGVIPAPKPKQYPTLSQTLWQLEFATPVGLAAGFDKNAEVWHRTLKQGFGFVEVGTVTPQPQPGNDKPRTFRLEEDKAVINRYGFNNVGMHAFASNMKKHARPDGVIGINIGKNKDTVDAVTDYLAALNTLYIYADYITVNISSPNTAGLRSLQGKEALSDLVGQLVQRRNTLMGQTTQYAPLLVKIAPDLTQAEMEDIVEVAVTQGVDGLIVSNTTISRPESLQSAFKSETGGLSGQPLFELSTQVLKTIYGISKGKIPLIGVGGISSAEQAYAKIKAGASLVQLYTALAYSGFALVREINDGLEALLERDGYSNISEAVGVTSS